MDILIITVLIIAAVILFLVELFVIPGISLAGISALVCIIYANYYAFANLGMAAGFITLGISGVACIGSLVWFMRSKMLDKLALKNIGKLNDPTVFIAWLNRICFHVCYDMTQKNRPQNDCQVLSQEILDIVQDPHLDTNPELHYQQKD